MDPTVREMVERRPGFYVTYCQNCGEDRIVAQDMRLAPDTPTDEVKQCPDCKLDCIRAIFDKALKDAGLKE